MWSISDWLTFSSVKVILIFSRTNTYLNYFHWLSMRVYNLWFWSCTVTFPLFLKLFIFWVSKNRVELCNFELNVGCSTLEKLLTFDFKYFQGRTGMLLCWGFSKSMKCTLKSFSLGDRGLQNLLISIHIPLVFIEVSIHFPHFYQEGLLLQGQNWRITSMVVWRLCIKPWHE